MAKTSFSRPIPKGVGVGDSTAKLGNFSQPIPRGVGVGDRTSSLKSFSGTPSNARNTIPYKSAAKPANAPRAKGAVGKSFTPPRVTKGR